MFSQGLKRWKGGEWVSVNEEAMSRQILKVTFALEHVVSTLKVLEVRYLQFVSVKKQEIVDLKAKIVELEKKLKEKKK